MSSLGFPGSLDAKESAYNAGSWVWSLCWEDSLEKEMATHSSILAWRIPWTWWATVLGVKKSWTWLSDFPSLLWRNIYLGFLSTILFYFIKVYEWFVYFANKSRQSNCLQIFSPNPYDVFFFCLRLPLLWKILSAWLGPFFQFLLFFLLPQETDLRKYCYDLYQRKLCICHL